jgi:hypothetical protein
MIKNIFFSAVTTLVIVGCVGPTHNFKIRFNDIQGLRKNDRVFFDKTAIGEVKCIEYSDTGNYLVSVAVEDQFSFLTKDSSTFYIDSNPEIEEQKAIRITQVKDDGNIIEKNTIVEGQSKYVAIYGQIANKFHKNFYVLESEVNEFIKGLQNLSDSEQIKRIERQLDRILVEIENLSVEMKHKLETEILPRIKAQIEWLRRRLEEIGKEEKLEYVDKKIKTISAKL